MIYRVKDMDCTRPPDSHYRRTHFAFEHISIGFAYKSSPINKGLKLRSKVGEVCR